MFADGVLTVYFRIVVVIVLLCASILYMVFRLALWDFVSMTVWGIIRWLRRATTVWLLVSVGAFMVTVSDMATYVLYVTGLVLIFLWFIAFAYLTGKLIQYVVRSWRKRKEIR